MDQHAVDVVRLEHLAVAINRLQHVLRLARDLRLQEQLLARQPLDGVANPLERCVTLGTVNVGDTALERVANEVVEDCWPNAFCTLPLLLPVPNPRRLSLSPVLPSGT